MRPFLAALLLLAAACHRAPQGPVDPDLAAALPPNADAVAGLDIDRLRATPLFPKLPASFRDASRVLAAYAPPNLVIASRINGRVQVAGAAAQSGPPDLLRYASDAPMWIVAHGGAALPLPGNLANLNRLLAQTDHTRLTASVSADRVRLDAEGVCATSEAAAHLAGNLRAISTLAKFPLDVRVEGATVRAAGSASIDAVARLF